MAGRRFARHIFGEEFRLVLLRQVAPCLKVRDAKKVGDAGRSSG
jgi:hypothetical protein